MTDFFKQDFCERCDFYKAYKQLGTSTSKFDCDPHNGKCTARTVYQIRITENPVEQHVEFLITKGKRHWKEGLLPKDSQTEILGNKHYTYYRNTLDEAQELVDSFAYPLDYGSCKWTYDVDMDISELAERRKET